MNNQDNDNRPRFVWRPWSLWSATAWSGLVLGVFAWRYWRQLDAGYGIMDKLGSDGLWRVIMRLLGM